MACVHWPIATDHIAHRLPLRMEHRITYCLTSSLKMRSSTTSAEAGAVGLITDGVLGVGLKRELKSSENLYVLLAYCDNASIVFAY